MGIIPVKIKDILNVIKQVKEEADNKITIFIAGRRDAGRKTLKSYLEQEESDSGIFKILELSDSYEFDKEKDFILFLYDINSDADDICSCIGNYKILGRSGDLPLSEGRIGPPDPITLFINKIKKDKIRFLFVLNKVDVCSDIEGRLKYLSEKLKIETDKIVFISLYRKIGIDNELVPKILELNKASSIFLARKLPVFRETAAKSIINQTALVNSIIGGITLLPGSDLPLLTFNQIKMILRIAAIYGEELSVDRASEVILTIGGGFVFRGVARQLLSFIPGPGWIIKGGVAYSGTVALGKAAESYFEGFK
ncbi:MAG: DUF697 domain-containing protein [Actinobacteria bacterium]|nr:DUF697 domain-containing protein [Actinomycetota bacterium]